MLLDEKCLKYLRKYNADIAKKWKGMEQKFSRGNKVTIANTGLVSAGKSSLCNALLDRIEKERFRTGAIPTTKKGDRERWTVYIDIVDTPGIDVEDNDDNEAFIGLMEADIIVVSHNVKMGMLNRAESDWLKRIVKEIGAQNASKRLIIACTWIDERDNDSEYGSLIAEIKRQVKEIAGTDIAFWEVSAKRYLKGRKSNKEALVNMSKLPEFRNALLNQANAYADLLAQQRQSELRSLSAETASFLSQQRQGIVDTKNSKEKKIVDKFATLYASWKSSFESFSAQRKNIESSLSDYRNEYSNCSDFINEIYTI